MREGGCEGGRARGQRGASQERRASSVDETRKRHSAALHGAARATRGGGRRAAAGPASGSSAGGTTARAPAWAIGPQERSRSPSRSAPPPPPPSTGDQRELRQWARRAGDDAAAPQAPRGVARGPAPPPSRPKRDAARRPARAARSYDTLERSLVTRRGVLRTRTEQRGSRVIESQRCRSCLLHLPPRPLPRPRRARRRLKPWAALCCSTLPLERQRPLRPRPRSPRPSPWLPMHADVLTTPTTPAHVLPSSTTSTGRGPPPRGCPRRPGRPRGGPPCPLCRPPRARACSLRRRRRRLLCRLARPLPLPLLQRRPCAMRPRWPRRRPR